MEVMEMKVLDFSGVRPAAKRLDQDVGHAGYAAQMDMVAAPDRSYRLVGRYIMQFFHIRRKDRIYFVFL
jgi:hypothetical protein